jgi:Fe2+ transport system protein B
MKNVIKKGKGSKSRPFLRARENGPMELRPSPKDFQRYPKRFKRTTARVRRRTAEIRCGKAKTTAPTASTCRTGYDRVLTHRFLGPVIMGFVLYALYYFTFTCSEIPIGWLEDGLRP